VSESDTVHYASTTKVVVKVMERNTWRGKPWGDLRKQAYRGCGLLQVWSTATGI